MSIIYLGKATPASGQGGGGTGAVEWGDIDGSLENQTDLAAALAAKQDVLTAGSGISISDNVISVTGGGGTPESIIDARTETAIRLWTGNQTQYNDGGSTTFYNWQSGSATPSFTTNANAHSGTLAGNKLIYFKDATTVSKSTDGLTWTDTTLAPNNLTDAPKVYYDDVNGVLLAIQDNSTYYLYSTDGGDTWTENTRPNVTTGLGCWGNGRFVYVSKTASCYTDDGINWTTNSEGAPINKPYNVDIAEWIGIAYGLGMFFMVSQFMPVYSADPIGTSFKATSSDGTSWTVSENGFNATDIAFINNTFIISKANFDDEGFIRPGSTVIYYSTNGIAFNSKPLSGDWYWKIKGYDGTNYILFGGYDADNTVQEVAYATDLSNLGISHPQSLIGLWGNVALADTVNYFNNKFIMTGGYITFGGALSVYTTDQNPTTASVVYDNTTTQSALTITSVGTGTITLSDTNTYDYNASGNQIVTQNVGQVHPNYICFIEGVGIKMNDISFIPTVTVDQTYNASSTNAQSGVAVASGIADTLGTIETALQGV